MKFSLVSAVALAAGLVSVGSASAATVTVNAAANIYASGDSSTAAFSAGGVLPVAITLDPGTVSFQFDSVIAGLPVSGSSTGGATCVFEGSASSGDGNTCVNSATHVSAANGFGSFDFEGKSMVLVGTFVGDTKGSTPAGLSYTDAGANSTSSFSPELQQVFFIGDGRTSSSALQTFIVPTGAKTLYLGFADAYGFVGAPGAYDDNYGSVIASYTAAVPEPATYAMLLGGLALLAARRRQRN